MAPSHKVVLKIKKIVCLPLTEKKYMKSLKMPNKEGQTIQWPKEKRQRSVKHYTEN